MRGRGYPPQRITQATIATIALAFVHAATTPFHDRWTGKNPIHRREDARVR